MTAPPSATPEERRAAVRTIATYAHDAEDAQLLLAALGLDPSEAREPDTTAPTEEPPADTCGR
jgi:hypothetical protein